MVVPPAPIQVLNDDVQVWEVWAVWQYVFPHQGASRWAFVTERFSEVRQAEMLALWRATLETSWVARRPLEWGMDHYMVRDVWPGVEADWIDDTMDGLVQDSSGEGTPPQVSPVINWQSGHPGRSYRGRTFWGPIREADTHEGRFTTTGIVPLQNFHAFMSGTFGLLAPPDTPAFAIVSRQHDNVPTDPPEWVRLYHSSVDIYLRTRRSRNRYPIFRV